MGDIAFAELPQIVRRKIRVLARNDPSANDLAVPFVGHAEDLRRLNIRMAKQEILDLFRKNVLAAANDHVFHASDDAAVPLVVEHADIARMHPAVANAFIRQFRLAPVAAHHGIPARAEFAFLPRRRGSTAFVDNFDLKMRMNPANGGNFLFNRVVSMRLKRDRSGLRHSVADRNLAHVHFVDDSSHDFDRARRARHDSRSQRRQVAVAVSDQFENVHEHRGDAVKPGAADARQGG